jgi:hypothetical protein
MPIFLLQFEVAVVYLVFFPSFLRAQELKRCSGVALVSSQGPRGTSFYGRLEGSGHHLQPSMRLNVSKKDTLSSLPEVSLLI